MSKLFANAKLDVPCPKCGHKTPQTVRRLELNPKLICPRCRVPFQIEASQLRKGLSDVDKALDDLKRTIKNFGKGF